MTQDTSTGRGAPDEFVEFVVTGAAGKGEFHCSQCGYGVTIVRVLPVCPMCQGTTWEQSAWSPFGKAPSLL